MMESSGSQIMAHVPLFWGTQMCSKGYTNFFIMKHSRKRTIFTDTFRIIVLMLTVKGSLMDKYIVQRLYHFKKFEND